MSDLLLINALGCAVGVDDADLPAEHSAEIRRAWTGAASQLGDPLPVAHLTVTPARGPVAESLSSLSQSVTLAAIEARRGQLWMMHAAGVADEEGRVIALIGPSGQGKTTAARTLATAYGYVSDETVGIEADGTVVPYRKPLSVIVDSKWVKKQCPPEELGLLALPEARLRLAAIVLLDRRPDGPDAAVVEDCDLGDALWPRPVISGTCPRRFGPSPLTRRPWVGFGESSTARRVPSWRRSSRCSRMRCRCRSPRRRRRPLASPTRPGRIGERTWTPSR
jgi:hypothetical protein